MDEIIQKKTISIALLAAGTLMFETTLTRFLGVAQFYHFAFLVVSLALLGLGASGTILSVFPTLARVELERVLKWTAVGFFLSVGLAYGGVNWIPFDSYSIAWERIQILFFILYYAVLSIPFVISGLGVGAALSKEDESHHLMYGANLMGSACGALLTPAVGSLAGVPGTVLMSGLAGFGVYLLLQSPTLKSRLAKALQWALLGIGLLVFGGLMILDLQGASPLAMQVSSYKGLSQARRYPGSVSRFGAWNAVSRVDVLSGAGTRRLPGLSYQYQRTPPEQLGMSVDAGPLQPISLVKPGDFQAAAWMPESVAFSLKPDAQVLVLNPGGGLGVLQALSGGAQQVTAVVDNPLLVQAAGETGETFDVYDHPRVHLEVMHDRSYLQQTDRDYELLYFPLTEAYRPVSSGAFSLAENYTLTVEGFSAALGRVSPQGMLVISRWLQTPPSEGLRLVATLVKVLERRGLENPGDTMVIYRSVQTLTVLLKPSGWTEDDLSHLRSFLDSRRFDLVWAPGIQGFEVNRYNKLPEAQYFQEVKTLLTTSDRSAYLAQYPFDISPPDDHHPFFFHFFTWQQAPQVMAALGRTWQPFGGSGYFILLALLGLVLTLSLGLILLPLIVSKSIRHAFSGKHGPTALAYFAFLGFGFMFIEIPLIQRWILFLGHPIYAFAAVVGTILLFSGLGSMVARGLWSLPASAWVVMVTGAVGLPFLTSVFTEVILGWPWWARTLAVILALGPAGFLMGIPFPLGLSRIKSEVPDLAPWAWGVNGVCSVIASVIASLLALSGGYQVVFLAGLAAYAGAGIAFWMGRT